MLSSDLQSVSPVAVLEQWVRHVLAPDTSATTPNGSKPLLDEPLSLTALAGDAGFRQYFRVNTQPESLLVTAPVDAGKSESGAYFAELSERLRAFGVATPTIYACDPAHNYLLIESFGRTGLLDVLSTETVQERYQQAQTILSTLHAIPADALDLPAYGDTLLMQEMSLFTHWFVGEMLAYSPSQEEKQLIQSCMECLVLSAVEQPQVVVHRDFHSRNLMCCDSGELGVIDFQDAVYGPLTYDLVSLLKDCYIRWDPDQVNQWALQYMHDNQQEEAMSGVSPAQFLTWFDLMGLQRHIKVLGIFARLAIRDNKTRYLQDLPLVIRYVLETARQYPQTQVFAEWFERVLLPLAVKQRWYRDYCIAGDQS